MTDSAGLTSLPGQPSLGRASALGILLTLVVLASMLLANMLLGRTLGSLRPQPRA